jgi:hypothetical protein
VDTAAIVFVVVNGFDAVVAPAGTFHVKVPESDDPALTWPQVHV